MGSHNINNVGEELNEEQLKSEDGSESEDDDVEVYYDVDEQGNKTTKPANKGQQKKDSKASWVYVNNLTTAVKNT